jgi:FkbM family methyltransferase
MYQNDLIYDVGMFNGDDTAYYLHRGYRVVSIEAHPTWAEDGRQRFAEAIKEGRLTILNAAIGAEDGISEMVVNETHRDWTTLNLELARASGWAGMPTHTMQVRTVRFTDVLAEYGIPFYLKVDIETFDHYCLEDLNPSDLPPYVSFESQNFRDLVTMRDKGFNAFKVIRQQDHRQVAYNPSAVRAPMPQQPQGWRRLMGALGGAGRTKHAEIAPNTETVAAQPLVSDWQFPGGCAGPFAEDTDGPWRSFGEAAMTWLAYDLKLAGPDFPGQGKWHDVHCRCPIFSSLAQDHHRINRGPLEHRAPAA